jgi:glycosyltransferase involved in cell wall biosynthesis
MKVSVIVAVYKDIEALDLIVQALKTQTYKNFELVVAEDNDSPEMKAYIESIKDLEIKHTFQEDTGIRKARSLNNGILSSSGEYLIFIDGDCVPYSTFVEGHSLLAEENRVLCGRRINLGPKYSGMLRQHKMKPVELEESFIWRFPWITADSEEGHVEEGIYVNPKGWIYSSFLKDRKKEIGILGCNYSCFKKDMININGYDESYGETAIPDDTDLEWRFKQAGLTTKSCKNVANIFHLYHSRTFRDSIEFESELEKMHDNKKNARFQCVIGLNTHTDFR